MHAYTHAQVPVPQASVSPLLLNALAEIDQSADDARSADLPESTWKYGAQAAFGMPVLADEYQEFLSYTRQNYTENHEQGAMHNGRLVYLPTDADFAAWDALMDTVAGMPRYEEGVYDILREEIKAFLEGNTSAQDAARVIQSRVKIAIAEGK